MKTALIAAIVVMAGYFAWDRYFSRAGRIETAYNACMKQMGASIDKAGADRNTPTPKGGDPAAAISKGMTDALTSLMQGLGTAMCGTLKEACTKDFDSRICQAALKHYP